MTEADNQLIHVYVRPEGFDKSRCPVCGWPLRPIIDEGCTAESCSMRPVPERRADEPPDYSTRQHFPDLTDKLFGDDLYEAFECHAGNAWAATGTKQFLIPWLFSDYQRFCSLFAELLRLPETVREFGYKECSCKSMGWDIAKCHQCSGSGQILRPWAKLVEEGK